MKNIENEKIISYTDAFTLKDRDLKMKMMCGIEVNFKFANEKITFLNLKVFNNTFQKLFYNYKKIEDIENERLLKTIEKAKTKIMKELKNDNTITIKSNKKETILKSLCDVDMKKSEKKELIKDFEKEFNLKNFPVLKKELEKSFGMEDWFKENKKLLFSEIKMIISEKNKTIKDI